MRKVLRIATCNILAIIHFAVGRCDYDFDFPGQHYDNQLRNDDYCNPNRTYVWCLPSDYNQEKHPFTYSHLIKESLPWNYDFNFVVEEISNVNDKSQTLSISMYFGVSWLDPRLSINETASEWTEVKTGPKNEVNVSPESLKYIWYPELEIYGLERFGRQRVLKEMSGVRIRRNKTIHYELGVRITISCRMMFDDYPLDAHTCQFQVGSYYDTNKTVQCSSQYVYDESRQRSLQHFIQFEPLPEKDKTVILPSGSYAACGFQIQLVRKQMQYIVQVYLPSCMFVAVSWVSFLIKPEVVPGRMALLVTLFLVLINIFNSVRERAPISSRLNAIDLYLVVCIFLVFGALMEYAVLLLLLKPLMRPKYTIDSGLKNIFIDNKSGVSLPMTNRRRASDSATNFPASMANPKVDDDDPSKLQNAVTNDQEEDQPHAQQPKPPPSQLQGLLFEQDDDIIERDRRRILAENGHQIQIYDHPVGQRTQAICDNIDAWAMWISPPLFVIFNIAYWLAYQHVDVDPPEPHLLTQQSTLS